jgi:TonB family protein
MARSHRLLVAPLALAFALGLACSAEEAEPAQAAAPENAAAAEAPPARAALDADAKAEATLLAAVWDFAEDSCSNVRRKLEYCSGCESAELKPQHDLLLAYCEELATPAEARARYDALITNHPDTEAAAMAIMRIRQIDAAELPPLGDYAGPKPQPIQRHQPAYPSLAQQAGIEGSARVRFDVRDDGGVTNVRVVESTPPLLFDSVALYAVSSWQYEKGQPAESQQITLRFDLSDDEVAAGRAAAGRKPASGGEAAQ